jgi:hypothetical protein
MQWRVFHGAVFAFCVRVLRRRRRRRARRRPSDFVWRRGESRGVIHSGTPKKSKVTHFKALCFYCKVESNTGSPGPSRELPELCIKITYPGYPKNIEIRGKQNFFTHKRGTSVIWTYSTRGPLGGWFCGKISNCCDMFMDVWTYSVVAHAALHADQTACNDSFLNWFKQTAPQLIYNSILHTHSFKCQSVTKPTTCC